MAFSRPISPSLRIAIKAHGLERRVSRRRKRMEGLRGCLIIAGSMEVDQFGYSTKSIRVPAEFAPWRPVHRRLVADPVVLPDESRKVVCSELLEVWVVADPELRPLPSFSVVRSLPEPVGRVVAVPVVRPGASCGSTDTRLIFKRQRSRPSWNRPRFWPWSWQVGKDSQHSPDQS